MWTGRDLTGILPYKLFPRVQSKCVCNDNVGPLHHFGLNQLSTEQIKEETDSACFSSSPSGQG